MKPKFKIAIVPLSIMSFLYMQTERVFAEDTNIQFDTQLLKNRGLDAGLGKYFASSARYTPGTHNVRVYVNGEEIGQLPSFFGKDGQLCVTEDFLQRAGLTVPKEISALARKNESADSISDESGNAECHTYTEYYPTSVIDPKPGEEVLSITVPPEARVKEDSSAVAANYRTGGTAGLVNYQGFTTQSTFSGSSDNYSQLMLEEGVNIHDWLLRSRQSLTSDNGEYSHESLYTYAQRTIVPLKKQIQIGQINTSDTLLSGLSITGVQLIPEDALQQDGGSGVKVSGIARGPQARVDIRQQGRVVYSTLVPAGPFSLTDVPVSSRNNDLDVTVTETDGSINRFIVPASAINGNRLTSPAGLSLAVGRYREDNVENSQSPMLATISDGWSIQSWLNVGAGIIMAEKYSSLAGSVDTRLVNNLTVSASVKLSDDQHGGNHGQSTTVGANYDLNQNLGINVSFTKYSNGYRELPDIYEDDFVQYSGQYSSSIHWSNASLGTFSLGHSISKGTDGNKDSSYMNASWGKTFGKANVNVSWQTQIGGKDSCHNESGHHCLSNNDSNLFYVNVSFPLGEERVSMYSRTRANETTVGAQVSGDLSENNSYSISAERATSEDEYDFSGSLNSNLHYTQLGLNASTQGSNNRSYSASLNGGIALHSGGVTFSPWAIKDTFAIVDAGKEVSGAEISTPSGPVWVDRWGQAVVPSMPAYRNTSIEMDTTSLSENIDIDNGFAQLAAGHGSVSKIKFNAQNVHRVMMHVHMQNGTVPKKGASIVDNHGNYIGTIVDDGLLFLEDGSGKPDLYLTDENNIKICHVEYYLGNEGAENKVYDNVNGVCK
ncbi:fimbrial biogenesis usher protein [Enterobacter roggenkampii]